MCRPKGRAWRLRLHPVRRDIAWCYEKPAPSPAGTDRSSELTAYPQDPMLAPPQDVKAFLAKQRDDFGRVVRDLGITME